VPADFLDPTPVSTPEIFGSSKVYVHVAYVVLPQDEKEFTSKTSNPRVISLSNEGRKHFEDIGHHSLKESTHQKHHYSRRSISHHDHQDGSKMASRQSTNLLQDLSPLKLGGTITSALSHTTKNMQSPQSSLLPNIGSAQVTTVPLSTFSVPALHSLLPRKRTQVCTATLKSHNQPAARKQTIVVSDDHQHSKCTCRQQMRNLSHYRSNVR
jgi:hypothetical protein